MLDEIIRPVARKYGFYAERAEEHLPFDLQDVDTVFFTTKLDRLKPGSSPSGKGAHDPSVIADTRLAVALTVNRPIRRTRASSLGRLNSFHSPPERYSNLCG